MAANFTNNTVKPSKPPFHKQENDDSCVPACLKMVLASFGVDISEAELRRLCDCTFDGTTALKAVDAARQLGFTETTKHNLSLTELETLTADGHFPIVFVDLTPVDGYFQTHAFIVLAVNQFSVEVLDPAKGARLIARDVFDLAWKLRLRLTILVER